MAQPAASPPATVPSAPTPASSNTKPEAKSKCSVKSKVVLAVGAIALAALGAGLTAVGVPVGPLVLGVAMGCAAGFLVVMANSDTKKGGQSRAHPQIVPSNLYGQDQNNCSPFDNDPHC